MEGFVLFTFEDVAAAEWAAWVDQHCFGNALPAEHVFAVYFSWVEVCLEAEGAFVLREEFGLWVLEFLLFRKGRLYLLGDGFLLKYLLLVSRRRFLNLLLLKDLV